MAPVAYRQAATEDTSFIFASWLKNARKQGDRAFMTNKVYFDREKIRISALLSKSVVVIFCNPEDPAHIYGFACYKVLSDLLIIHYVYVKKSYRKLGIASGFFRSLFPRFQKDQTAITHVNEVVAPLRERYRLLFDPCLQEIV
jgi:hypothetical protein